MVNDSLELVKQYPSKYVNVLYVNLELVKQYPDVYSAFSNNAGAQRMGLSRSNWITHNIWWAHIRWYKREGSNHLKVCRMINWICFFWRIV